MCSLKEIEEEVRTIKVAEHQFREGKVSEKQAKVLIMKAVASITKKEQSQWS